jgi:hypothetical protein
MNQESAVSDANEPKPRKQTPRVPTNVFYERIVPMAFAVMAVVLIVIIVVAVIGLVGVAR